VMAASCPSNSAAAVTNRTRRDGMAASR
jgi:hypothetical protein